MIEAIRRGARFNRILTQDAGTKTVFALVEGVGRVQGDGYDGELAASRHGRQHDKYEKLVERVGKLPEKQRLLWTEALDRTGQHTDLPPEVRHAHDLSA